MSRQLTSGVLGRKKKAVAPEFIILVDTTLAGSASDTMQLPIRGTDMTIDWGDGIIETGITQTSVPSSANWRTHIYPDGGGVKQIKITGLDWIYFNDQGDILKLLEIQNWGTGQWASMASAFRGCSNMTGTFTDVPDLSNVTSMNSMFYLATNFNSDISSWAVGNVTNMGMMFRQATNFNSDISGWNTANVENMSIMFRQADNFNSDISNWNVGNVTNMSWMFQGATAFNSDISSWDTAKVTNMAAMFYLATNFNSDISGWNTANVTNMGTMFREADNFNQDLSGWCVEKIASRPNNFDNAANSWIYNTNGDTGSTDGVDPATIINRPIWGTCPQ